MKSRLVMVSALACCSCLVYLLAYLPFASCLAAFSKSDVLVFCVTVSTGSTGVLLHHGLLRIRLIGVLLLLQIRLDYWQLVISCCEYGTFKCLA